MAEYHDLTGDFTNDQNRMHKLPMDIADDDDDVTVVETFFKDEMRSSNRSDHTWIAPDMYEFESACIRGDVEIVRQTLLYWQRNKTPEHEECFRFLKTFRYVDYDENTLLMRVCSSRCASDHALDDIVELLIKLGGATPNLLNTNDECPLRMAIRLDLPCRLAKLLTLGAAVDGPDSRGDTPLMLACRLVRPHAVNCLLDYGADFGARNAQGTSALEIAEQLPIDSSMPIAKMIAQKIHTINEAYFDAILNVIERKQFDERQSCALFQLHCYPLRESNGFILRFNVDQEPMEMMEGRGFTPLIAIGMARFGNGNNHQVNVRFWGKSAVREIWLNGVTQKPYTNSTATFLYSSWPMVRGWNELEIHCHKDCIQSAYKLLVRGFWLKPKAKRY